MEGILLVNKPVSWTSFDVVARVRKIIATEQKVKPAAVKVGHTGTLDPLASGLLILLVGKKYTRLAGDFSKLDKAYVTELFLGSTTLSGDREFTPEKVSDHQPTIEKINQTLKSFTGPILQTPPIYSAIKINGQRAYKLARDGRELKLQPRPVTIYQLSLVKYEYPTLTLKAKVSSGTYIRSLAVDIGQKLQTGAYMNNLIRTRVGKFKLEDSLEVANLTIESIQRSLIAEK